MKFKLKEYLKEDWRDGQFTEDDFNKYVDKTMEDINRIARSIEFMISKHPEYADLFDNLVSEIVDKFSEATHLVESKNPDEAVTNILSNSKEIKTDKGIFTRHGNHWEYKPNTGKIGYSLSDRELEHELKNHKIINEGNNITSKLPSSIDSFLQDIAQMYGTISYTDVMKHEYTPEEIKKLSSLRKKFRIEAQYEDDEEAQKAVKLIVDKVSSIVKGKNIKESVEPAKDILDEVSKLLPSEVKIDHKGPTTNRGFTFDLFKIEGPTGNVTGTCVYLADGKYDISLTNSSEGKFSDAESIARFFADHYNISM